MKAKKRIAKVVNNILFQIWRTQDFCLQDFFHDSFSPEPFSIPLESFQSFTNIHRDIHNFVFIGSVLDVIDIGVKLLPVSLTPVIKPVLGFHPFHDTDN